METIFDKYLETTERVDPIKCVGRIVKVQGLLVESRGPNAIIGEICRIEAPKGRGLIRAEVVGLREETVQLMAFEETDGIEIGARVIASGGRLELAVSRKLLGRVLDALGNPIDGKGEIESPVMYPAVASPPDPLKRRRVSRRITTGVRAIDGLLAVGRGQRLGIFAGSGVGKSTLLGMIARNTSADVNVVALIGERGREVNDFIANDLGPEGLARSVLVVTPSNSPPLARLRGAHVATAVAEFFRDEGLDVMLLFDSITRFARAQREIGLASGEPPTTRGYTPSMFDSMPKLLERSGTSDRGSITGFYTILVDGDDMNEPVSDTVRGILDGHIVLSRRLAQAYHYPAIDVLESVSRLAPEVSGPVTKRAAAFIRKNMAVYAEAEDLINVGAYHSGSNPAIDEAVAKHGAIEEFLIQDVSEKSSLAETLSALAEISGLSMPPEEMGGPLPETADSGGAGRAPAEAPPSGRVAAPAAAGGEAPARPDSVAALFASIPGANPIPAENPD
ncbi:MAG: FliI/YscN family ATPase [Treponema sp.]|jgi:flagellum-specific ATP synthase|nr:FliI/YscN family ATPase [Treponema sp.]